MQVYGNYSDLVKQVLQERIRKLFVVDVIVGGDRFGFISALKQNC